MEPRSEREVGELRQRLLDAMAPLRALKSNMDSLFGEFYPGDWEAAVAEAAAHPMLINFYRAGDRAVIECTVPGARKQDIEITMSGNVVTISAEFRVGGEGADRFIKREIPHGRQQRAVQIPFRVQPEQMKARYENGILRIVMSGIGDEGRQSRLSIE